MRSTRAGSVDNRHNCLPTGGGGDVLAAGEASRQDTTTGSNPLVAPRVEDAATGPALTSDGVRADSCAEDRADLLSFYNADTLLTLPPLFLAVAERCPAAVRLLLQYGANANAQDSHGTTPLHLSASVYFQNFECAIALIQFGAKIHCKNNNGTSPGDLSPDLAKSNTDSSRRASCTWSVAWKDALGPVI